MVYLSNVDSVDQYIINTVNKFLPQQQFILFLHVIYN